MHRKSFPGAISQQAGKRAATSNRDEEMAPAVRARALVVGRTSAEGEACELVPPRPGAGLRTLAHRWAAAGAFEFRPTTRRAFAPLEVERPRGVGNLGADPGETAPATCPARDPATPGSGTIMSTIIPTTGNERAHDWRKSGNERAHGSPFFLSILSYFLIFITILKSAEFSFVFLRPLPFGDGR